MLQQQIPKTNSSHQRVDYRGSPCKGLGVAICAGLISSTLTDDVLVDTMNLPCDGHNLVALAQEMEDTNIKVVGAK